MHLHRTKLGYLVNHGLAPCYKEIAISSVKQAAHFISSFDESFNSESNKKQLDAHVNFLMIKVIMLNGNILDLFYRTW